MPKKSEIHLGSQNDPARSSRLAKLPLYDEDNGALTKEQLQGIKRLAQLPALGETCSTLF